jgi:hypothetical protein
MRRSGFAAFVDDILGPVFRYWFEIRIVLIEIDHESNDVKEMEAKDNFLPFVAWRGVKFLQIGLNFLSESTKLV